MDPFSAGMFASIGSAFKFADLAVRIAEVGSENAVFVRAIQVVRSDLEEVERLLSSPSVQSKLTGTPGKLPWIKTAIHNTRCALNEIGKWVERARVEQETTGSIKFDTRIRWVFNDHEKLVNRKTELSTCHQQLSNVLGYLIGLEDVPSHPVSLGYEDASYFDDILSRHRRKASMTGNETATSPPQENWPNSATAQSKSIPSSRPPPIHGSLSLPDARIAFKYGVHSTERSSSLSSAVSPPGSPPPTYAAAVSIDPVLHDIRLGPLSQTKSDKGVSFDQSDCQMPISDYKVDSSWAYTSNFNGIAVPELAGDTVVFSATNSAGPVNPYELNVSTEAVGLEGSHRARKPRENIAEMLGDLHFPVELPTNGPGPPPGYPPQPWAKSDQVESVQPRYTQLRNRKMSEAPPRTVHRRPVPTNAMSDSLLTISETPVSLMMNNVALSDPNLPLHTLNPRPATELSSDDMRPLYMSQRHSSYTTQSEQGSTTWDSVSTRHYSAPPPLSLAPNMYATAFSAVSTSSWGLDTQPKVPEPHRSQEPAVTTRMQSQKRIMDLLGSIGT